MSTEIVPAPGPGAVATRHEARLAAEAVAVRSLVRAVAIGCAVAIPLCIAIWIGIVAWAVGDDGPSWGVWIGMACGVGIFAGSFYGGWAAFVAKAHLLDSLDEDHAAGGRTDVFVSDEELAAEALAADPETVVPADAVSLLDLVGRDRPDVLPAWYMPAPMGRPRSWVGWRLHAAQGTVGLVISAFLTINACGLCNTYGQLHF